MNYKFVTAYSNSGLTKRELPCQECIILYFIILQTSHIIAYDPLHLP